MDEKQLYEFKESSRKERNEMLMKEIDSHYSFIKQLLTFCIAGIGFVGLIIRSENVTKCDADLLRLIIISLSLCSLFCIVYLFGQKYTYADLKKKIAEHARNIIDGNIPQEKIVYAKISPFFLACEILSYLFFCLSLLILVWYSIG